MIRYDTLWIYMTMFDRYDYVWLFHTFNIFQAIQTFSQNSNFLKLFILFNKPQLCLLLFKWCIYAQILCFFFKNPGYGKLKFLLILPSHHTFSVLPPTMWSINIHHASKKSIKNQVNIFCGQYHSLLVTITLYLHKQKNQIPQYLWFEKNSGFDVYRQYY